MTHGRFFHVKGLKANQKSREKKDVSFGNFEVQEVAVVHGGWCGPDATVEVGSCISLSAMGLVHSY